MRYFLFISLLLFTASCKSKKYSSQDLTHKQKEPSVYDGRYQYMENDCLFSISISNLLYDFKTQNLHQTGILKVKNQEESTFFQFKNLYGEYQKKYITAEFINNNTIIIQNYGNTMNEFIRFSECSSKYIELKKIND